MRYIKYIVTLLFLASVHVPSLAQDAVLLDTIPNNKEGLIRSEKNAIATVNWLEKTPVGQYPEKYARQGTLMSLWLGEYNTVINFEQNTNYNVVPFRHDRNLVDLFLFAWVRYFLTNNHSIDKLNASLAGIRLAMKIYKQGVVPGTSNKPMRKNEEMEKLIALEDKGELENWVKERLAK